MAIENVSDTARWVAFYRAMESERPDALFNDPFARKLAGEKGDTIVNTLKDGRRMAWTMITRTQLFDEIVMREVQGGGVDLVLNLAAGLDARPWRLDLPQSLHWIDVDLPDILRYKRETIGDAPTRCSYEAIATDLADASARKSLFATVGTRTQRALVLSEGLLIYLGAENVAALATDLHDVPAFARWATDLASPRVLKLMEKSWAKEVEKGNAPFRFAPAAGTDFFTPFGWRELEFHSIMDESRRLKREMSLMWLWRPLGKLASKKTQEEFRKMSAVVVLGRV